MIQATGWGYATLEQFRFLCIAWTPLFPPLARGDEERGVPLQDFAERSSCGQVFLWIVSVDYDDYPDEEWVDDEDDSEDDLLVCPSCGKPVHEETQQCPYCGDWIIPAYPGAHWKRAVFVIVAVLLILALILWVVL